MIVCIVGPTGIGKTALSLDLAKHYKTDIISGDSVQVYRKMDIGSAKVSPLEQKEVPHHLIDIYDIDAQFSVAVFQKNVRQTIKAMQDQGKLPMIVGGTGLYIKSVLYDYDFTDALRDDALEDTYKAVSNQDLHALLKEKDLAQAQKIHPNNRKRVLQAIGRAASNKMSDNTRKDEQVYDYLMIGLTMDRKKLHKRIEQRVESMFEQGLVDEVKGLLKGGSNSHALDAIGYKEVIAYLQGKISLEEAKELVVIHTRQLAKKQYTFFRNQLDVTWIDKDIYTTDDAVFKRAVELIDAGLKK